MSDPPADRVLLVHGLWLSPWVMGRLRLHFQRNGFRTAVFNYTTIRRDVAGNAALLAQRVAELAGEGTVHLVAHSLGGLVTVRMLHEFPMLPVGRVVTLGTPYQGSAIARVVAGLPGGGTLMAHSMSGLERGSVERIPQGREVGSLAGDLALGPNLVFWNLPYPNDGTVAVAETRIEGLSDHWVLPVTHMGLLVSQRAAELTENFLRHGRFEPPF